MMSSTTPTRRLKSKAGGGVSNNRGGGGGGVLASLRSNNRFLLLFGGAVFCLGSFSLFPILVLESVTVRRKHGGTAGSGGGAGGGGGGRKGPAAHLSPGHLVADHAVQRVREQHAQGQRAKAVMAKVKEQEGAGQSQHIPEHHLDVPKEHASVDQKIAVAAEKGAPEGAAAAAGAAAKRKVLSYKLEELKQDGEFRDKPVARGVAGRLPRDTPAVDGAKRAHIECEINVDSLAYWNDPQGARDEAFVSPFKVTDPDRKYITFSPDHGGWNNIRMSMEIIFVIAAATGRTLVLPPKAPLYLLGRSKEGETRHRGFADFYPIQTAAFQKRVKTISMEEFVQKEGVGADARFPVPENLKDKVVKASALCDKNRDSDISCVPLYQYLESVGNIPNISSQNTCLVFDKRAYHGDEPDDSVKEYVATRCGKSRDVVYWSGANPAVLSPDAPLLHFNAEHKDLRLLAHFYSMLYFTDSATDNYFKRFVRDFLHYHDTIYCAAGKIVKAVQKEAEIRGFHADPETGAGGFSSLHVRRGDLQYKRVKIPAKEWYENTKEVWLPKEILYVATDERDKSFFDDLAVHHDLRFLDDYWDFAGLGDLDGNYMGMIDTIVASRGRAFAGTWFSTFSGFINRMRGYHGMSMMDSWYSFLEKKDGVHKWEIIDDARFAFEWPDGWIGIDADEWPTRDKF